MHGVEVARGEAPPGHAMVLGDNSWGAGLPGRATIDPVFGLPATWMTTEIADVLAMEGATVIDRASVIVTHLSEVIRRTARDLLSRQDVAALVESVKESAPALAEEIGGDGLSLAEVQRILRELLDEGVPIRDLTRILESVTSKARETRNPETLVESARGGARSRHLRGRRDRRQPQGPHVRPAARAVAARGGPHRRHRLLAGGRPGADGVADRGHRRRRLRRRERRPPAGPRLRRPAAGLRSGACSPPPGPT